MSVLVKYRLSIAKISVRINLAKSIGKERLNIGYILTNPNRYFNRYLYRYLLTKYGLYSLIIGN